MNCPKCNKPNRDKAVFCKYCGASVVTKSNAPLQALVGMTEVKNQLHDIVNTCEQLALRAKKTGVKIRLGMDMVIVGNTGTGKSKVVDVLQHLLYSTKIIKNPKAMIVDAVDWENFSKEEKWEENIAKAKGGLLVIENAQKLLPQRTSDDIDKLDKLFKCMNDDWNNDPIVILSGLPGLKAYMTANPDVESRFEYHFDLKDFSVEELAEICEAELQKKYGLGMSDEAGAKLRRIFKHEFRNKTASFDNGHMAVKKAADIFGHAVKRDHSATEAGEEDVRGTEFRQKSYEEVMAELDRYVGIDEIKETVQKIVNKIEIDYQRKGEGAKREIRDHFLFLGNPGTGKTTIARVFADILNSLDVLPTGQLVEVDRSKLVAGYVGQTALAVQEAVEKAMGGILFIDEAYALKQNESDSFGQEAIDTLLKLVEDNRGKFVCIAAGYTKEMGDFIATNSGMTSRFNETVNFRDYDAGELTEIFRRMVAAKDFVLDEEAEKHIENYFRKMYIGRNVKSFGNARAVRNAFERAEKNQSTRLQKIMGKEGYSDDMLRVFTRADIEGEESLRERDLDTILAEMDELVGMDSVKKNIRALATKLDVDKKMQERGFAGAELTNVHIVITGNPGTGKTTVALKLGEIFKAIGLLPSSKVVEKEPKNILSSYMNASAQNMDKACDEAMGGILFIDEAYALTSMDKAGNQDKTGVEAVEALMTRMVKDAGKFVVVCAGYRKEMEAFIDNANPGFRRRFTDFLHIEDYTAAQLVEIFILNAQKQKLTLSEGARERLGKLVAQMVDAKSSNFGNAGEMTKLLEQTKIRKSSRLALVIQRGEEITQEMFRTLEADDIPYDAPKAIDIDQCMKELDELIGLEGVKKEIREIADYIAIERRKAEALGKKFQGVGDHYLFVGNPGTGKTTVARIMGDIFCSLGVLPTNKLVEVTRKDLVAGYVGQTALQTEKAVKSAVGGIFFIDEAYSLKGNSMGDFGQEATDTILPMMLDYKGKMIFIAAGYPREMSQWIDTNSGLESRFTKTIRFEDYNGEELAKIFLMKARKDQLELTPEAETAMRGYFNDLYENRGKNFANAREVNNYFDRVKRNQSTRLARLGGDITVDMYKELIIEDFE